MYACDSEKPNNVADRICFRLYINSSIEDHKHPAVLAAQLAKSYIIYTSNASSSHAMLPANPRPDK